MNSRSVAGRRLEPISDLRAADLHEGSQKRREQQEDLFRRLIAGVNAQIKQSDNDGGKSYMYEVPRFIPMYPQYDVVGYMTYAIRHFRSRGFDVRYSHLDECVLYIFWQNSRDLQASVDAVETLVDESRKTKMIIERIRGRTTGAQLLLKDS